MWKLGQQLSQNKTVHKAQNETLQQGKHTEWLIFRKGLIQKRLRKNSIQACATKHSVLVKNLLQNTS